MFAIMDDRAHQHCSSDCQIEYSTISTKKYIKNLSKPSSDNLCADRDSVRRDQGSMDPRGPDGLFFYRENGSQSFRKQ